jgi:hypothetical protein
LCIIGTDCAKFVLLGVALGEAAKLAGSSSSSGGGGGKHCSGCC